MQILLDENMVVNHTKNALARAGWTISSFATTSQTGVDVIAERNGLKLFVEAKGITSSKSSSSRFGIVQSSSQIFISVAAALLKTAELKSKYFDALVAIAVPSQPSMQRRLVRIEPVMRAAEIGLLWVDEAGRVTAWNSDALSMYEK